MNAKLITPRGPFFGRDTSRPTEMGVYVPPDEVFPGIEATERSLVETLEELNRDDTLIHAARLNTLVSGPGDFDPHGRQRMAVRWLCTPDQARRIDQFASRSGGGPVTVFFRGQILELIRWAGKFCKNLPGDGEAFQDRGRLDAFVKALLIASVLWGKRVYGTKLSAGGDVEQVRERAIGALRKGAEEGNLAPHLGIALGRGKALFVDHLPARFSEFETEFEGAAGVSLTEYRACAAAISMYTLFNHTDGPLFMSNTVGAETALKSVFPAFFALDAQRPEELATSLWVDFDKRGYRALRERPILVTSDGRGIVLDPTFYSEKISIGPLFHLLKSKSAKKGNELLGKFGLAFEDYANGILKRMYPSRPGLIDRLFTGLRGADAQGNAFEIDATLIDVSKAIVFEMKAAWLREDAIADDRPEALLADIRAKYGIDRAKPAQRPKGVAQLARSIGAIVRGEWFGNNREFDGCDMIHPVLVVHDARLDAPALGHFLDREFRALLGPVPAGKNVAPLTVMPIQDLENLESSINAFSFVDLLSAYSRECPDRLRSLHNFIVGSPFGPKILPSGYLQETSFEILDLLRRELFPKTEIPDPSRR